MAEKKTSTRGEKARKVVEELKKLKTMPRVKAPVKKKAAPVKKEESWVAKLKKKVQAFLGSDKKKPGTTQRTRQIQQQLAKAGVKVKTDREREEAKKKTGHNPGNSSKKKSGY